MNDLEEEAKRRHPPCDEHGEQGARTCVNNDRVIRMRNEFIAGARFAISKRSTLTMDHIIDVRDAIVRLMGTGVTLPTSEEIIIDLSKAPRK
jgi:hypothetical protein